MRAVYILIIVFFVVQLSLAQSACISVTDHLFENKCFIFVNERLSFWEAEQYCNIRTNSAWSQLAKVENFIDARFLSKTAASEFSMTYGDFWVGVYRPTVYDYFRYMDGTYCPFENFSDRNPSMNFVSQSVVNGKWQTVDPDTALPFVCYYPLYPVTTTTVGYDSSTFPWADVVQNQKTA
uniref:C-type lectin domain-containing protein n=1 Tax=Caenorhabditis japonica TaxID=281687 RepID=A0A8R1DP48_CAEJA